MAYFWELVLLWERVCRSRGDVGRGFCICVFEELVGHSIVPPLHREKRGCPLHTTQDAPVRDGRERDAP